MNSNALYTYAMRQIMVSSHRENSLAFEVSLSKRRKGFAAMWLNPISGINPEIKIWNHEHQAGSMLAHLTSLGDAMTLSVSWD